MTSGLLREVKENSKPSSLKVIAVAYEIERWSLTRSSNYSDLTGEILVFWKSGRSRKVVARGGSTLVASCYRKRVCTVHHHVGHLCSKFDFTGFFKLIMTAKS